MQDKSTLTKEEKHRIKDYFRNLFDMRKDTNDHGELRELKEENTVIHGSKMWILMLAILIA